MVRPMPAAKTTGTMTARCFDLMLITSRPPSRARLRPRAGADAEDDRVLLGQAFSEVHSRHEMHWWSSTRPGFVDTWMFIGQARSQSLQFVQVGGLRRMPKILNRLKIPSTAPYGQAYLQNGRSTTSEAASVTRER